MTQIIDITEARQRRDAPGPECRCVGPDGQTYHLFYLVFKHKGREWSLDLWARDQSEADEMLDTIRLMPVTVERVYAGINE